jgi:excisionase family DNA binding protein
MFLRKSANPSSAQVPATPVANPEPILTREQLAERLQLEPSTVYELTRRRNKHPLPAMKAGKVLRFYWSDVERWLRGEEVA